jgi:voltage-gated potassium channel
MPTKKIKQNLRIIIFGTTTKAGVFFDLCLLWLIVGSVITVVLESVKEFEINFKNFFITIEWCFTILFTIEYFIRVWISEKSLKYIFSLWGIIDLLSFLPTYLGLFLSGMHYLIIIRVLRLLRVFRILKLSRYIKEAKILTNAIKQSSKKIIIFLLFIFFIALILGTLLYVIEGEENGFKNIPESIYWAIITITTVGYGDITPHTFWGKLISSVFMIISYAIIAIPTGIVVVDVFNTTKDSKNCTACNSKINENDNYCKNCGAKI